MGELLERRALVWALTRRALIARYRGTALGFLWTFIHPLLLFGVYALVFGVYVRVQVEHYPAFLLAGLLPWTWFSTSLSIATTSILADAPWIRQAAFPPSVPPVVAQLSGLVNFAFGLPVLLAIFVALGVPFTPWMALLPLLAALQLLFGLGLSLATAALTVRYRDVNQLVQALLPLWFFLTPVVYPASAVPPRFAWLLWLNPLAPLSAAYQAVLSQGRAPAWTDLVVVLAWGLAALVVGHFVLEALRDRIPEEL